MYEDELWPEETLRPFRALLQNTITILYGCELGQALRYWPAVENQLKKMDMDLLPPQLKFDTAAQIRTIN